MPGWKKVLYDAGGVARRSPKIAKNAAKRLGGIGIRMLYWLVWRHRLKQ